MPRTAFLRTPRGRAAAGPALGDVHRLHSRPFPTGQQAGGIVTRSSRNRHVSAEPAGQAQLLVERREHRRRPPRAAGRRCRAASVGVRSLSITAARMPSSRSPSCLARQVKRNSRRSAFSMPGSRRAARTSSSVQAIDSGDAAPASEARRGPSRWSRAAPRWRRGRRPSKASSIASRTAASAGRGRGREGGDRRRGSPLAQSAAASAGPARLGDEIVGEAGEDARRPAHAVAGQRRGTRRAPRARAASRWVAPTSGIEADAAFRHRHLRSLSPTTRWLAWPPMPTPPPMTKPCISATIRACGSGRCAAFSRYSSAQKRAGEAKSPRRPVS